jgi:hypothetical protein
MEDEEEKEDGCRVKKDEKCMEKNRRQKMRRGRRNRRGWRQGWRMERVWVA